MEQYEKEISEDFEHDGASLPRFFRSFLEWMVSIGLLPSWLIPSIDRAGRVHDWLMYRYPNRRTFNRWVFIRFLIKFGIAYRYAWVRYLIHLGIFFYDIMPQSIRIKLKQLV